MLNTTLYGATGQLSIPAITDGNIFAYNVVITLGALISQGGKCDSLADCLGEEEGLKSCPSPLTMRFSMALHLSPSGLRQATAQTALR